MCVLLTGAAGNLGTAVSQAFADAGIDCIYTDRTFSGAPCTKGCFQPANLLLHSHCHRLLQNQNIHTIVHLANYNGVRRVGPQATFSENVTVNSNIFQTAVDMGVKKIIFASSIQAIVGTRPLNSPDAPSQWPYFPLDGQVPPNPLNVYGASKIASEQLLAYLCQHHPIQGISIRFPGLPNNYHFQFQQKKISPELSSANTIDEAPFYLHQQDAASLILAILKADLPGYRCYFPTGLTPAAKAAVPDIIQRYFPTVPLRQPIDQIQSLIDHSHICRDIDWKPQFNFDQTTA